MTQPQPNPKQMESSLTRSMLSLAVVLGLGLSAASASEPTAATAVNYATETLLSNQIASTPEFKTFIENYIAAVNAKDQVKLKELVHPKCINAMRKDNELYESRFETKIPSQYRIFVYEIAPTGDLSFAAIASVPVRPSHKIQLSWDISPSQESGIPIWIIMENGKWHEVIPNQTKSLDDL